MVDSIQKGRAGVMFLVSLSAVRKGLKVPGYLLENSAFGTVYSCKSCTILLLDYCLTFYICCLYGRMECGKSLAFCGCEE